MNDKKTKKKRRGKESYIDIGNIFGLDVGGTLVKLVYFEKRDEPEHFTMLSSQQNRHRRVTTTTLSSSVSKLPSYRLAKMRSSVDSFQTQSSGGIAEERVKIPLHIQDPVITEDPCDTDSSTESFPGNNVKRSASMLQFSFHDDTQKALDNFYNFASSLDSYMLEDENSTGFKDVHLNFYSFGRAANATAVGKCTLLCISKETFESIVGSLEELIDLATKKCILSSVPIFAKISLKDYEVERLVKMMTRLTLRKGRTLMVEGKPVTNIRRGLYLLNDGEIKLNSTTSAAERTLRMGEFFGDDMLSDDPNFTSGVTATVTVDVTCDVLSVDAVSFALGGLHRLCSPTTQKVSLDKSITSARFDKISILGAGTFGQVWLVMDKINKTPYALKIQNKRELIDSEQMYGVIREKNLMETLDHPFVVKLINAYQDEKSLFMVMTFVQGCRKYL